MAMVIVDELRLQRMLDQAVERGARAVLEAMGQGDKVLDRDGIAELTGYSARSVPKLVSRDGLPAAVVAGRYRANRSAVLKWLEDRARPRHLRRVGR